jgi:hypothetical protein
MVSVPWQLNSAIGACVAIREDLPGEGFQVFFVAQGD